MAAPAEPPLTDLAIRGTIPAGLSGQLIGIGPDLDGDGVVHGVHLHDGHALAYRRRRVITDAVARRSGVEAAPGPRHRGPDVVDANVVAFGDSILAFGDGTLAYELAPDLGTLRRVDLAGQAHVVAPFPKQDPVTGDLHLIASTAAGGQAHVVVSAGALTRSSRAIAGAPGRLAGLAITRDRIVFAGHDVIGVTTRHGDAHPHWFPTGVATPSLLHAHDQGDAVVIVVLTPSLERWTTVPESSAVHREVLDPGRQRAAHVHERPGDGQPWAVWTTSDDALTRHDLMTATVDQHRFRPGQDPGDLVFVSAGRSHDEAGVGWLVGFVHHPSRDGTDLVVLDADDVARPAMATVHLPLRVPRDLRCTWVPATWSATPPTGDQR